VTDICLMPAPVKWCVKGECVDHERIISRRTIAALCAATVLVAACAGWPQQQQQQQQSQPLPPEQRVNQTGYSSAFKQGYADGCNSVQSARRRNEQRYQSDTNYMMGWNDGFSICSKRK
jgi:hypothetical protein